jgi:hypothetical protein
MKTVLKKLLADVERYRVIRRDLFCQHLSESQIKTLDRQLRYSRSIQTFHHACGLSLMLPRRRSVPSESSLASHVARYTFLHQETEHRRLLTKDELQTWFPALFRPGLPHGYFVDHSERRPSLGLLQVDTHLRDPRRIQAEFSDQIRKHSVAPGFQQLIEHRQFRLVMLVASSAKANVINALLLNSECPGVQCEAVAVPALFDMQFGRTTQRTLPDVVGL